MNPLLGNAKERVTLFSSIRCPATMYILVPNIITHQIKNAFVTPTVYAQSCLFSRNFDCMCYGIIYNPQHQLRITAIASHQNVRINNKSPSLRIRGYNDP